MIRFTDSHGQEWIADAQEEATPRHHGRWFLTFQRADDPNTQLALPEVRWQTHETALRTLRTMSDFELRRRVGVALRRRAIGVQ